MDNIHQILEFIQENNFIQATISEKEKTNKSDFLKCTITPFNKNGERLYQFAKYTKTQVKHLNVSAEELEYQLASLFNDYRQFLIKTSDKEFHCLKLGQKFKINISQKESNCCANETNNRQKNYILNDGEHLDFLVAQGVMSNNYLVKANMQHKFRQINRYLEFIRDVKDELPQNRQIHIIDFGCGKSYLTFAVYYYLHDLLKLNVFIHGLDLKVDVINDCNALKEKLGYENLTFEIGDIAQYKGDHPIDMVMTLHACDTATDYALYHAINWKSKVILSVPCCQHELNKQIQNDDFKDIFSYGIIQERTAALLTDSLRANMLEVMGYKTQILEFIDIEHTPKNLLIRAIRKDNNTKKDWHAIDQFVNQFHLSPTLYNLLRSEEND